MPVIYPDTYKYLIWDVIKSMLYLMSIFSLTYLAAYRFDLRGNESATLLSSFDFTVDIIQVIDIVLTFFTARPNADVTLRTKNFRKYMR